MYVLQCMLLLMLLMYKQFELPLAKRCLALPSKHRECLLLGNKHFETLSKLVGHTLAAVVKDVSFSLPASLLGFLLWCLT